MSERADGGVEGIDWSSDEAIVRAAVPNLQVIAKASRELSKDKGPNGLRKTMYYCEIKQPAKPFRVELACGWGTSYEDATRKAWPLAREHPTVQAFERAHNPAMQPAADEHKEGKKKPCLDCDFIQGVGWRCTMNCGPSIPAKADPLGIEAARKIAGGHSKLTRDLISQPAAPLPAAQSDTEKGLFQRCRAHDGEPCDCPVCNALRPPQSHVALPAAQEGTQPPLKMFVWDGRGSYKMCVTAKSVAEARSMATMELDNYGLVGASGDSPVARARTAIVEEMPHIYHRPNAEFALTVNGETEELNILLEYKEEELKKAKLASAPAAESATTLYEKERYALDQSEEALGHEQ